MTSPGHEREDPDRVVAPARGSGTGYYTAPLDDYGVTTYRVISTYVINNIWLHCTQYEYVVAGGPADSTSY